jgi:hypothetical protein
MRASLLAAAVTITLMGARVSSASSHGPKGDRSRLTRSTADRAPCTRSLRRYRFPRLLMPNSLVFPPVECCRGTSPSQEENSRPLWKAAPRRRGAKTCRAAASHLGHTAAIHSVLCKGRLRQESCSIVATTPCSDDCVSRWAKCSGHRLRGNTPPSQSTVRWRSFTFQRHKLAMWLGMGLGNLDKLSCGLTYCRISTASDFTRPPSEVSEH